MLEVKNLTKLYKTKGGHEVKALDGVSLSFEDRGMVFLLGKSGSGKSTLLNMCGGLDAPDGGEIIVKGKSSKDFTPSDFDSYRNTFIGFVFQEYNILSEFSVEDNIALALELQGKPKDSATIKKLLSDVDLEEYAKRKPNTLSGGQKQRVAIARALIKNPEIIMADEPTGALDSRTGKQVFDTLKKLSKDKLVIVVSHDREFAEEYGDRIIELKDGKVISDVVKSTKPAEQKDENIAIVGSNTLIIKKGARLSNSDISDINRFISECDGDVLISKDRDNIQDFKKAGKINDDNSKDYFEKLGKQPVQKAYSKEDSKFIRSRLPMRHAVKMGASSIKVKPVRFTFTVLLSVIAFVLFGMFSCLMFYDAQQVNSQSLYDAKEEFFLVSKNYYLHNISHYSDGKYESTYTNSTFLTRNDIAKLGEKYNIIPVYADNLGNAKIGNLTYSSVQSFYSTDFKGVVAPSKHLQYVIGKEPASENEVAISEFMWESIKAGTLTDSDGNVISISGDNLDNVKIRLADKYYDVVGVFKNQKISDKYLALKQKSDERVAMEWSNELRYGSSFINYICVTEAGFESIKDMYGAAYYESPRNVCVGANIDFTEYFSTSEINNPRGTITYVSNNGTVEQFNGAANSVILPYSAYAEYLYRYLYDYMSANDDGTMAEQMNEKGINMALDNLRSGYSLSSEEVTELVRKVLNFVYENIPDFVPTMEMTIDSATTTVNVLGFMPDVRQMHLVTLSSDLMKTFKTASVANGYYTEQYTDFAPKDMDGTLYARAYVMTGGFTQEEYTELMNFKTTPDSESTYEYSNSLYDQISMYTELAASLSKIFLWVGVVMAAFAMLLLFNFITVSISYKKKEIGILRAVGARGSDVFKIFFSESAIIVGICSVISIILTALLSSYINGILAKNLGMQISFFVFGFVSIAMIIIIAVVSALISTFLPVFKASRKKPVESIRSM